MKVKDFIFCDKCQYVPQPDGSTKLQVSTPLEILNPLSIPGNFTFDFMIALEELAAGDTVFRIVMTTPSGETMMDSGPRKLGPMPTAMKQGETLNFSMEMRNVPLFEEGDYTVHLFEGDSKIGEYSIKAVPQRRMTTPFQISVGKK